MKHALFLLALLVVGPMANPIFAASNSVDPALVGRYSKPGDPGDTFDLRADGTCTITQGKNGASGTYTLAGPTAVLTFAGDHTIKLEFVPGGFIGPDKAKWIKVGPAAPLSAPAAGPGVGVPNAPGGGGIAGQERATIIRSEGNVKRLILGLIAWAADHNGSYPTYMLDMFDDKYFRKNESDLLRCPLLQEGTPYSYFYYGKFVTPALSPETLVIVSKWANAAGERIVAHKDGSVALEIPDPKNYPPGLPVAVRPGEAPPLRR